MDEEAPLISVVTIAFNDYEGLLRTCRSVNSQIGAPAFEHVVIDGGSTDGSAELLDVYEPSVFVSEPDRGIYHAMNKGIQHAKGRFLVFLNSGDTFADRETLRGLDHLVQNASARWGYGRARVVDSGGQDKRAPIGLMSYSPLRHRYGLSTICHQAVWMEKNLLLEIGGFSEGFGLAGDYDLLVKAGTRSKPHVSPRVDINFLAGGASDRGVYKRLKHRSDARVSALNYGRVVAQLDLMWTYGQISYVWLRKRVRSLLASTRLEALIVGGRRS